MKKFLKKITALMLSVLFSIYIIPESAFAAEKDYEVSKKVISDTQYCLIIKFNEGINKITISVGGGYRTTSVMDTTTYEQVELNKEKIEDSLAYIKDGMLFKVLSYKGNVFGVEPPLFVELEVTYTEPGIKGATSTGQTKPCTVETGANFNVPIFVEIGDKIRIDTRTGSYMERV